MNITSKLLLASVVALSFAAPVLAQEEDTLIDRNVYLFENGKMMRMSAKDHDFMMHNFEPMQPGTMIYLSGGKFYMAHDHKMPSGKMLSTEIFGKDMGIGSQK